MHRHLRTAEVDFAIASQPLAGPGLCTLELVREEVLLAVPAGHPLATGRASRWPSWPARTSSAPALPLATVPAGTAVRPRGTVPAGGLRGRRGGRHPELAGAGLGLCLLPAVARRAIGEDGPVAWLRLDAPDCHRTLTLVWRRNAHLSPAARDFRRLARERLMSLAP
ncbi:LysR family transcriptional regulator substrate-binding protein [Streptomyces nogalater]